MENKGLTITVVFEANSANYGEGMGNITALKKITRGNGEVYTYISRQALRYNMIEQMKLTDTPIELDGSVLQFAPDANIIDYPEIDLFGYMRTEKGSGSSTRSAVARLSHAVSLEPYASDLDFLTNKGLFDRYNKEQVDKNKDQKKGGNIAQSEIHRSFYSYTLTVDLDSVGIDGDVEIAAAEKAKRVVALLDTIEFLYRDIKGRRENFAPLFIVGGVYDRKNPFFDNKVKIIKGALQVDGIASTLAHDFIKNNTVVGLVPQIFTNEVEIKEKLSISTVKEAMDNLKQTVNAYYK